MITSKSILIVINYNEALYWTIPHRPLQHQKNLSLATAGDQCLNLDQMVKDHSIVLKFQEVTFQSVLNQHVLTLILV